MSRALVDAESSANLKQPAFTRGSRLARSIAFFQPRGRPVSAWRKTSHSPCAAAAPAFICAARPRGASIQTIPGCAARSGERESSPDTDETMTSVPEKSAPASVRASASASRYTGMMTLRGTDNLRILGYEDLRRI